jgi:hypothetical protein
MSVERLVVLPATSALVSTVSSMLWFMAAADRTHQPAVTTNKQFN